MNELEKELATVLHMAHYECVVCEVSRHIVISRLVGRVMGALQTANPALDIGAFHTDVFLGREGERRT